MDQRCNLLQHFCNNVWFNSNNDNVATPDNFAIIDASVNPQCLQQKYLNSAQSLKTNTISSVHWFIKDKSMKLFSTFQSKSLCYQSNKIV